MCRTWGLCELHQGKEISGRHRGVADDGWQTGKTVLGENCVRPDCLSEINHFLLRDCKQKTGQNCTELLAVIIMYLLGNGWFSPYFYRFKPQLLHAPTLCCQNALKKNRHIKIVAQIVFIFLILIFMVLWDHRGVVAKVLQDLSPIVQPLSDFGKKLLWISYHQFCLASNHSYIDIISSIILTEDFEDGSNSSVDRWKERKHHTHT